MRRNAPGRARWRCLAAIAGIGALTAGAISIATAGDRSPLSNVPKTGYVGANVCFICHIDFARKWSEVDHSKKLLDPKLPANLRGCEACHGPGGEHVAGKRDQIVRWPSLAPSDKTRICLKCHQGKVDAAQWQPSPHAQQHLSCDGCHEVHYKTGQDHMLRKSENDLCLTCHKAIETEAKNQTHHPLVPDVLTCTQCHNPHGSPNANLLRQPQGKLCDSCHPDGAPQPDFHKKDDFMDQHGKLSQQPGRMANCAMCHSKQDFCDQCHGVSMPHPDDFALKHAKIASFDKNSACFNCHDKKDFCGKCHDEGNAKAEK